MEQEPKDSERRTNSGAAEGLSSVEKGCILDAIAGISWQTVDCCYNDWRYLPNINLWRDYLPYEIEHQLPGKTVGAMVRHEYAAGELVESFQANQLKQLSLKQFQPTQPEAGASLPQAGRFYSKDSFSGVDGIYQGNKFPCRVVGLTENSLSVDFNHPLSRQNMTLEFRIERIKASAAERGGRCNDIPALLCDYGPGMQASLPKQETVFRTPDAFTTQDGSDESSFFGTPSFEPFWDTTALSEVSSLYDDLLSDGMDILDLMAGAHSPLQECSIAPASVFCAGLNPEELEANPICTQRQVLNVNEEHALDGFPDARFDAVLIHAAIEYVTRPDNLMQQVARILKPGGHIIISFSNRSVQGKVIRVWSELNEFERLALVLSYLRNTHSFHQFNGYSMRGRFRPEQDRLSDQLLYSDPVYAVWATRKS